MRYIVNGQSLLEVLIAIGVAVLLVTGLMVGTSVSLRTSKDSQRRSQAIKYAQEGIELTRNLRDRLDWDTFLTYDTNETYDPTSAGDTLWCLASDAIYTQSPCEVNLDNIFTRSVAFDWDSANIRMIVTVDVLWQEGSQPQDVTLDTYFTKWRQ